MDNLNPYDEQQFRSSFEQTEIYHLLRRDFQHLTWDKHCDIYKTFTPRQFLGDSSKNIFSMVPFYYLNYLLQANPKQIYDLGCGWNIFKKYIPNIIGVDDKDTTVKHGYADECGLVDQEYVNSHQNYFESVFSINALHFVPLSRIRVRVLDFISMIAPGGRGFIALNSMRMVDRSSDEFLHETFGTMRPSNQQLDWFTRNSLKDLPCKIIVFDVDVESVSNDIMEGNIRLVFEK